MLRLAQLRKQKGYTQSDFAKIIKFSKSTVAMWELGQREPGNDTLLEIANFFDVSIDYLLGNDQKEKPTTVSDDGLCKINSIFARLSDENRAKLLELSNLYLNAQNKTEENQ